MCICDKTLGYNFLSLVLRVELYRENWKDVKFCEINKLNVKMSVNKNIQIDYTKYQKVPSDTQFELNSNKFMSSNVSHRFFFFLLYSFVVILMLVYKWLLVSIKHRNILSKLMNLFVFFIIQIIRFLDLQRSWWLIWFFFVSSPCRCILTCWFIFNDVFFIIEFYPKQFPHIIISS